VDSEKYQTFMASEEVKYALEEWEMASSFFKDVGSENEGWTWSIDEGDTYLKNKNDESGLITVQAGTIIRASLTHLVCHFAEADLF